MEHVLETALELPRPRDEVFAFFARAEHLERITPPELRFHIVTPAPVDVGQDALIEYRLRLFGVPFSWLTRITVWRPPQRFVDVQLRGPYRVWIHEHGFIETDAGTLIRDRVTYGLPWAPAGELAYPLVRRQLGRIFAYRQAAVRSLLAPAVDAPHAKASDAQPAPGRRPEEEEAWTST